MKQVNYKETNKFKLEKHVGEVNMGIDLNQLQLIAENTGASVQYWSIYHIHSHVRKRVNY